MKSRYLRAISILGSNATIKITYISELPVDENAIRLTIPTTIAPRLI
jgi:hypothetical protein